MGYISAERPLCQDGNDVVGEHKPTLMFLPLWRSPREGESVYDVRPSYIYSLHRNRGYNQVSIVLHSCDFGLN